jgi:hypothetical protein
VLGLSFAGYTLRGMPATYDADVLYGLHIDTDLDAVADHDIWVRFGQDDAGNWGVQVENLPGVDTPIIGPVDTDLDSGDGRRVFAGLRDDPFFFDLEGFRDSAMTGEIVFDAQRDFALFQNATMIVVQLPMTSLANGGSTRFRVWATSARK